MFTWLYDIPIWVGFLIITGTSVLITCVGIWLLRLFGHKVFFLASMIFLIAAMDYPFRGDLAVSPGPVETMYHNVMGH